MNADSRIVDPTRLEGPPGEIRFLFLPQSDLFATRAGRLRRLSADHPMGGYLAFLAHLAEAQQETLERFPTPPHPGPEGKALCSGPGRPLPAALSSSRDPAWREGLAMILRRMEEVALPSQAQETVAGLLLATDTELEELADRVLAGELADLAPHKLPFVAAALQVYWVRKAADLVEREVVRQPETCICPVCGLSPVAGIVHGKGAEHGLRYLCCSLCAAQWHMERIKCSNCTSSSGIDYYILEGSNGAVKAESCDGCGCYLKLFYLEKESGMEAMADDLASIALDMLMADEGKVRVGLNLLLHPGGS